MTMPSHPFELVITWRDGREQVRSFQTLPTALAAGQGLRPSLVRAWTLSVVVHEWRAADTPVEWP